MSRSLTAENFSFRESAAAEDSPVTPFREACEWFQAQRAEQPMRARLIPLQQLEHWRFRDDPLSLAHDSGRFFSVVGLHVETDFGPIKAWDQPIIHQPEIGILGVITRCFNGVRHFLMQAKVEPGNLNGLQLSPTEQATRSNFTRVHGGAEPPYHRYFVDDSLAKVLIDRLQGEQGSRFLRKRNRNMIVEVTEDIPVLPAFRWLTLAQIRRMLRQNNLVNMDARSVLSCVPTWIEAPQPETGVPVNSEADILNWLHRLRSRYHLHVTRRSLDQMAAWQIDADGIRHRSGRYFTVVAVEVEAVAREVRRWTQPLLHHTGQGLNGFILQRLNGLTHFLVRACMYPGNWELFELGSTVSRSGADEQFGKPDAPPFLNLFQNPPESWVRYRGVQSEEGGRFYHYANHYMVLELPPELRLEIPQDFCWMTRSQIQIMLEHGYFNIEGRNLLACYETVGGRNLADAEI